MGVRVINIYLLILRVSNFIFHIQLCASVFAQIFLSVVAIIVVVSFTFVVIVLICRSNFYAIARARTFKIGFINQSRNFFSSSSPDSTCCYFLFASLYSSSSVSLLCCVSVNPQCRCECVCVCVLILKLRMKRKLHMKSVQLAAVGG